MSSYREDEDILLISGYSTAGMGAEWVFSKEELRGGVGQQAGRVLGLAPYRMRCWISSTDREEQRERGRGRVVSLLSVLGLLLNLLLPAALLPAALLRWCDVSLCAAAAALCGVAGGSSVAVACLGASAADRDSSTPS